MFNRTTQTFAAVLQATQEQGRFEGDCCRRDLFDAALIVHGTGVRSGERVGGHGTNEGGHRPALGGPTRAIATVLDRCPITRSIDVGIGRHGTIEDDNLASHLILVQGVKFLFVVDDNGFRRQAIRTGADGTAQSQHVQTQLARFHELATLGAPDPLRDDDLFRPNVFLSVPLQGLLRPLDRLPMGLASAQSVTDVVAQFLQFQVAVVSRPSGFDDSRCDASVGLDGRIQIEALRIRLVFPARSARWGTTSKSGISRWLGDGISW